MKFLKNIFKIKTLVEMVDVVYEFGKYKIILPENHVLKLYQKEYPLYDRFLPILCSEFKGLIIDIGANIGDTSIAIFSKNQNSFIVGVEPDPFFYAECVNNIKSNNLNSRFLGVNQFVSTNEGNYDVERSNTMATSSISKKNDLTGISTISFLKLMNLIPVEKKFNFDMLKIDTDGFDWDIIGSFYDFYEYFKLKPRFVFFEMQTYLNNNGVHDVNRNQIIENYKKSITKLRSMGYNNFCLFDNFGTPIKITQLIDEIFDLNEYIKRSQIYNSHSTIYYMDILAFQDNETTIVKEAINNLYKITS